MRLATLRLNGATTAARIDDDAAVELPAPDVGTLLAQPDWRSTAGAGGPRHSLSDLDRAPVVPRPGKVVCVGLNYQTHITEMGRDLPEYPTLFSKFAESLIGADDTIVLPASSGAMDWEAELAVVIGAPVRHADTEQARAAIAGYTILNDVTARDWQYRTKQWLQGKTFEATTPLGPDLVTLDELGEQGLDISCSVDGETMQSSTTADLVFDPVALVRYISSILTLTPGDVIATGTTGGVGHARTPPRYLEEGSELVTRVAGIGELVNVARREKRDG